MAVTRKLLDTATRYSYNFIVCVFNTVCYGYLRSNFRAFRRFLIHGNLCCFIIAIQDV